MKILVAGKYDPLYNRTKIILDGLRSLPQVSLSFCNYAERGFRLQQLRSACAAADVVLMPSFTHMNVPLVKLLCRKPVIFDPLISRYLTKVFDYKQVWRYSPRALKNFLKDRISMGMADLVLCDTYAHQRYFHETIGIPLHRMQVLPVGVNTDDFKPAPARSPSAVFTAGFYGGFIPLQGTARIIEAARLLQEHDDIRFRLIGSGFEHKAMLQKVAQYGLQNISLPGWTKYNELAAEISGFDVCLGIFGESLKADLVIPNKIYHYAAMRKAIITKDTPAIKEIFENGRNIILCSNEPAQIAEKVLQLKRDAALREQVAGGSYATVTTGYNHRAIGEKLLAMATELLRGRT